MSRAERHAEKAIDYIYRNTRRDGVYSINWEIRVPVRRYGRENAPEVARDTIAQISALGYDVDASPGHFMWWHGKRVFHVRIQMHGTRNTMIESVKIACTVWTGKKMNSPPPAK